MVATGEVKCIDDEIPFEIPQGWEWCRLGEICKFLSRGKSPSYSDVPNQYPVFAQKCNLKNGGISLEQARFLNPNTIDKWPDIFKLKTDDVLVNSTGTGTVCRTRLFHENYLGSYPFTVPDSHVSIIRSFEEINSTFLYSLLNSKFIQDYWNDNLAGSTNQKELYIGTIQKTPIPLPPLAEQHRIVSKIEELMPLVDEYGKSEEELKALNASLPEALKKSILQEAIQGKLVTQIASEGDASVLLQQIEFEKQKLVKEGKLKKKDLVSSTIFRGDDNKYYESIDGKEVCIDDEILFEIPQSWSWCRLKTIAYIIGGYAFDGKEIKSDIGRRVVKISDFNDSGWVNKNITRYNGKLSLEQYALHRNDIVIAMTGGTVGKAYHIENMDEVMLLNQRVASIRAYIFYTRYLYMVVISPFIQDIINDCKNSTNDNISMSDIGNFLIPVPPKCEQVRIIQKYDKAIASIMSR